MGGGTGAVEAWSSESVESNDLAKLLCELCASFYSLGWNLGTGGGVSLQDEKHDLIFLTPSGVHKERMEPKNLFVFSAQASRYIYEPEGRKPSASSNLFLWLHNSHGAGAVIHTHSMYSNLVTRTPHDVWSLTDQEYIKGVPDYETGKMLRNHDTLKVPIIANQETENLLLPDLVEAVRCMPAAACVLVKNHGAYHFGRDIWRCKAQAECLEYLFELGLRAKMI